MSPCRARPLGAVGWSAALGGVLGVLHGPAADTLRVPLGSLEELSIWVDGVTVPTMAMAFVRLMALAGAWYLAAVTAMSVVANAAGWRPVNRAAAHLTPNVIRRMLSGTASLGLAGGVFSGATPAMLTTATAFPTEAPTAGPGHDGTGDDADTATMTRLPHPADDLTRTDPSARPREPHPHTPTATMTRLPDPVDPNSAPSASTTTTPANPGPAAPPSVPRPRQSTNARDTHAAPPESWVVGAGDSFWSIAEEAIAGPRATAADDHVARYWCALIEANRARLTDPANPDLLLPGQRLVLPSVDA